MNDQSTSLTAVQKKEVGNRTERKFFEAMNNLRSPRTPFWLLGIRKATKEEDSREGTDAVLVTNIGEIRVQIKTSVTGMLEHVESHGTRTHLVIVIPESLTDLVEIRIKIINLMGRWWLKNIHSSS